MSFSFTLIQSPSSNYPGSHHNRVKLRFSFRGALHTALLWLAGASEGPWCGAIPVTLWPCKLWRGFLNWWVFLGHHLERTSFIDAPTWAIALLSPSRVLTITRWISPCFQSWTGQTVQTPKRNSFRILRGCDLLVNSKGWTQEPLQYGRAKQQILFDWRCICCKVRKQDFEKHWVLLTAVIPQVYLGPEQGEKWFFPRYELSEDQHLTNVGYLTPDIYFLTSTPLPNQHNTQSM